MTRVQRGKQQALAAASSSHYSEVMALSGVVRAAFLTGVLLYFTGDQSLVDGGVDYSQYKDFIMDNYEDWIKLVSLAFKYGVPEAHETITEYLDRLHEKCQEDESCRTALDFIRLHQKYVRAKDENKTIHCSYNQTWTEVSSKYPYHDCFPPNI